VLLPLLWSDNAVPILIACVVLYHACSNLVQPQWSTLMRDLVPEKRRGRYFGHLTRIVSLTTFIALVCAGGVLTAFNRNGKVLAGFLTVFAISAIARFVSVYYLACMHDPQSDTRTARANLCRHLAFTQVPTWITVSALFCVLRRDAGCDVHRRTLFTVYMLHACTITICNL
jgi:MFS family permease